MKQILRVKRKDKVETICDDEEYKKYLKDKILTLKHVFEKDGTITAANASKNADGGFALVLMTESAKEKGLTIARIRGFADVEKDTAGFSIAPTSAVNKLL